MDICVRKEACMQNDTKLLIKPYQTEAMFTTTVSVRLKWPYFKRG